jgi:hypothetical protein
MGRYTTKGSGGEQHRSTGARAISLGVWRVKDERDHLIVLCPLAPWLKHRAPALATTGAPAISLVF